MAKYYASEAAQEIALMSLRIHGGYGYSREYDVERYYRDTPLMIVGEGTNAIQKNIICPATDPALSHLRAGGEAGVVPPGGHHRH